MITESLAIWLPKYDDFCVTIAVILSQMRIIVCGRGFTPDSAGEVYNSSQESVISCGGCEALPGP